MSRRWLQLLLGGLLLGGLLWGSPMVLARWLRPGTAIQDDAPSPAAVDAMLGASLPSVGAQLLASEVQDGVRYAVYQLPLSVSPLETAQNIRAQATAQGLEMYASPVDGLDAQIRAYAGAMLRQEVLLIPTLPADNEAPAVATLRERPLLSLIVAGLGDTNAPWLPTAGIPLTVAIQPYRAFSLHLGEAAALSWHEVLVDLYGTRSTTRDRARLHQAMAAVPFATGILCDARIQTALPDPFDLFVQPNEHGQPASFVRDQWIPAQRGRRRSARETLNRTRLLAARDGAAAMIIDASDPELSEILDWAREEDGFRLALASEVLRADQVRGVRLPEDPSQPAD